MKSMFEGFDAFMLAKTEQIYSNESINESVNEVSQIIVNYLVQHNLDMDEGKQSLLVDEIYHKILPSFDVVITHAYKVGFSDGIKFQAIMKEIK